MTTQPISESGMIFGPYKEGCCFRIESSCTYLSIQNNVKVAEFLLLRKNTKGKPQLLVIEAKKSSPKPETMPRFEEFIQEIKEKLVNSFSLTMAAYLKRHELAEAELPEHFWHIDWSCMAVKFILVIKDNNEAWLPPLHEALQRTLCATVKTWALGPQAVLVLNEQLAQQHGLIIPQAEGV